MVSGVSLSSTTDIVAGGSIKDCLRGRYSGISSKLIRAMKHEQSERRISVKAFVAIELFGLFLALLMPVIPSKTDPTFRLPPDFTSYAEDVLMGFGLIHLIFAGCIVMGWLYWLAKGRPSWTNEAEAVQDQETLTVDS